MLDLKRHFIEESLKYHKPPRVYTGRIQAAHAWIAWQLFSASHARGNRLKLTGPAGNTMIQIMDEYLIGLVD